MRLDRTEKAASRFAPHAADSIVPAPFLNRPRVAPGNYEERPQARPINADENKSGLIRLFSADLANYCGLFARTADSHSIFWPVRRSRSELKKDGS
jgi:hypothetical protein